MEQSSRVMAAHLFSPTSRSDSYTRKGGKQNTLQPDAHTSGRDEAPVLQTPVAARGLCFTLVVQIQEDLSVSLPQHDEADDEKPLWKKIRGSADRKERTEAREKGANDGRCCTSTGVKMRLPPKSGLVAIRASLVLSLSLSLSSAPPPENCGVP